MLSRVKRVVGKEWKKKKLTKDEELVQFWKVGSSIKEKTFGKFETLDGRNEEVCVRGSYWIKVMHVMNHQEAQQYVLCRDWKVRNGIQ